MSVEDEKVQGSPQLDVESMSYADSDDAVLEMLGYKQEFKRDFSFLGLWSLCSSELAVLPGVAGTIWCVYSMSKMYPCSSSAGTLWAIGEFSSMT